jgi:hypothetical protein
MRMLMTVKMPNTEFNAAVRYGSASKTLNRILEDCAAEAVYFTETQGLRTVLLVVNIDDPSQIPRYAEPWFLSFNATVEFKVAMTPEDIKKSGLEDLGRSWTPDQK